MQCAVDTKATSAHEPRAFTLVRSSSAGFTSFSHMSCKQLDVIHTSDRSDVQHYAISMEPQQALFAAQPESNDDEVEDMKLNEVLFWHGAAKLFRKREGRGSCGRWCMPMGAGAGRMARLKVTSNDIRVMLNPTTRCSLSSLLPVGNVLSEVATHPRCCSKELTAWVQASIPSFSGSV